MQIIPDYSPTMGDTTSIGTFKAWCQKVLPLVYDDSLSYYELLNKVVNYLNEVITNLATTETNVTNLHTAYEELQSYCDDFLNGLTTDDNLINSIEAWISTHTSWLQDNSILTQHIVDSNVTTPKIADNSITNDKLSEELQNSMATYTNKINTNESNLTTLTRRVDNIVGQSSSTDGNTELIDIRVGVDGTIYNTAGNAVRSQINGLKSVLGDSTRMFKITITGSSYATNDYWLPMKAGDKLYITNNTTADITPQLLTMNPRTLVQTFDAVLPGKSVEVTANTEGTHISFWIDQYGVAGGEIIFDNIQSSMGKINEQSSNLLDLKSAVNTTIVKAKNSSTVFTEINAYSGMILYVQNKTSGLINCSINDGMPGNTLFNIGNLLSGESVIVHVNTVGTYFRTYCGATTVNDENIVITDITAIYKDELGTEHYHSVVTAEDGIGRYWNIVINKHLTAGDTFFCKLDEYSGSLFTECAVGYIDDNDNYIRIGKTENINVLFSRIIPVDTNRIYIQIIRSAVENNVWANFSIGYPDSNGLLYFWSQEQRSIQKYYTCLKDGTGDFNTLVGAINTINSLGVMDATLYIGAGVWDIVDEFGANYLNTISSTNRGLYLQNRLHIICSSDAVITCHYTGSRETTINWLSAFNSGPYGFTLENATIESSKCRYTIHDERDYSTDHYINKYINCKFKHDNTNGGFASVIGGGLGYDGHIIIDGCVFESPNANNIDICSYHNTWYDGGDGRSTVELKGTYFKGTTTFRGSWFGASQDISTFLVHDNSFGIAPIERVESQSYANEHPEWIKNIEMITWNNEIRL